MPDPDLTGISDGPPVFPTDRKINDPEYSLSEIKRILWFAYENEIRKRDESAFVAFTSTDVAAGSSINLHLKNPTEDKSIDVSEINVSSQFRGNYTIYDEFSTAPSGGTDAGIDNLLMDTDNGTTDDGDMVANEGVTFTELPDEGTHYEEQLPSGGSSGNSVGGRAQATTPLMEPGREIVIELTNDSTSERPGSIGVVFEEEPYVYSTQ